MSAADDKSLLAMRAAKMSMASIAMTMGWSGLAGERRVARRLAELDSGEAAPEPATHTIRRGDGVCITKSLPAPTSGLVVGGFTTPQAPAERRPYANPVRTPERVPVRPPAERPVRPASAEGEGLVTRTFVLSNGERGAAVLLDDNRLVFTETGKALDEAGKERVRLGGHVAVAPGEGCYQLVEASRG